MEERRRLSTAHYTFTEIQKMNPKEREKIHTRREKYSDAMNDLKKIRNYYKGVLHEKLKEKVHLKHQKRKEQEKKKIQNENAKKPIRNITYSAIQKLSKPNSLNYKIEEGKFSASKTYRIMQIIDACKTKGSFHKEDEDEVWVILKRNQNLLKMEEYIYNRDKENISFETVKRVCGKKEIINIKAPILVEDEKEEIEYREEKISRENEQHQQCSAVESKNESNVKPFPHLRFLQNEKDRFSGKHWLSCDMGHEQRMKHVFGKKFEIRNTFMKSEAFGTTTRRMLEKSQNSFDLNILECSLQDYFDMKSIKSTKRSTSLPSLKALSIVPNHRDFTPEKEKYRYLMDGGEVMNKSRIKTKSQERIKKSEDTTKRIKTRPPILPLCIEDLEVTCSVKEVKKKNNLWRNPADNPDQT